MPARPTRSPIDSSSVIAAARAGGVELGDLAAVALGERLGARVRLVEQRQRALGAPAVDQRLEVPARLGRASSVSVAVAASLIGVQTRVVAMSVAANKEISADG